MCARFSLPQYHSALLADLHAELSELRAGFGDPGSISKGAESCAAIPGVTFYVQEYLQEIKDAHHKAQVSRAYEDLREACPRLVQTAARCTLSALSRGCSH